MWIKAVEKELSTEKGLNYQHYTQFNNQKVKKK